MNLAAGFVCWMCLNHALCKSVTVISTLFEKMTLWSWKNNGDVHSVIPYWLVTLLQMDLLPPCNKTRHSAQRGTRTKVIQRELLFSFQVKNVLICVCIGSQCHSRCQAPIFCGKEFHTFISSKKFVTFYFPYKSSFHFKLCVSHSVYCFHTLLFFIFWNHGCFFSCWHLLQYHLYHVRYVREVCFQYGIFSQHL